MQKPVRQISEGNIIGAEKVSSLLELSEFDQNQWIASKPIQTQISDSRRPRTDFFVIRERQIEFKRGKNGVCCVGSVPALV
jgi:hypothetical protein